MATKVKATKGKMEKTDESSFMLSMWKGYEIEKAFYTKAYILQISFHIITLMPSVYHQS